MANQHTGNFEQVVKDRFKCSAKEVLLKCQTEGLSYQEAEKILGFKHVTIRKWAKRFDIKLSTHFTAPNRNHMVNTGVGYIKSCKSQKTNKTNILSKCWINMSLYSVIKAKS